MRFVPTLVILTLGCVIHSTDAAAADPIAAAPIEEIAEPTAEAVRIDWRTAKGRSKKLEAGAPHGLWIWHDGNRWHVRTTTKSNKHRFTGFVAQGNGTTLEDISTTRTELKDRVRLKDDRVRFDFTTNGHADGFDFRVRGKGCVRFAIRVDGEESGKLVKLGEKATQPQSWHFRLCAED
jgi:hypothetical protein